MGRVTLYPSALTVNPHQKNENSTLPRTGKQILQKELLVIETLGGKRIVCLKNRKGIYVGSIRNERKNAIRLAKGTGYGNFLHLKYSVLKGD